MKNILAGSRNDRIQKHPQNEGIGMGQYCKRSQRTLFAIQTCNPYFPKINTSKNIGGFSPKKKKVPWRDKAKKNIRLMLERAEVKNFFFKSS
jgi:hypothetical protein